MQITNVIGKLSPSHFSDKSETIDSSMDRPLSLLAVVGAVFLVGRYL